MGLYGMMRTGVSGMNAQANKLSAVADNIANASTNGYKRGSTEFSSLVLPSTSGNYNSGSVLTQVRHNIGAQGGLTSTSSTTDLALDGNGFFVVQDASGMPYLTRAGSFVPDKNGELVNVAGFTLMGYPYPFTGAGYGFDGMVPITLSANSYFLPSTPTTEAVVSVNLRPERAIGSSWSTSLIVFDELGTERQIELKYTSLDYDVYGVDVLYNGQSILERPAEPTTKSRVFGNYFIYPHDPPMGLSMPELVFDDQGNERFIHYEFFDLGDNKWALNVIEASGWESIGSMEMEFDASGKLISNSNLVTSSFSYSDGTIVPITVDFSDMVISPDPGGFVRSNGNADGPDFPIEFGPDGMPIDRVSQSYLDTVKIVTRSVTIDGLKLGPISIDLTDTTQIDDEYRTKIMDKNGNAGSKLAEYSISDDGVLFATYEDGSILPIYQIAIANVASPDRMIVISGNVFSPSAESGDVTIGTAASNGNGKIRTGALENSNVDIAQELTDMIEAQRSYTANSKVFQTGSELMDVLVNLKR